jgi:hypothetical protein
MKIFSVFGEKETLPYEIMLKPWLKRWFRICKKETSKCVAIAKALANSVAKFIVPDWEG